MTIEDDNVNNALIDEIMLVVASMNRQELTEFAELQGLTLEEYERIIANWKADRLS